MKMLILFFSALVISSCAKPGNKSPVNNANQNAANVAAVPADSVKKGDVNAGITGPDALVSQLYALHKVEKGPFFELKDRRQIDKFFDKPIADKIWKDLSEQSDGVGVIDFDVLYNAQDFEIKKFAVSAPKIDGENALVTASFENFGQKQSIDFPMVRRGDSWKIADVKYSATESLGKYFKESERPE